MARAVVTIKKYGNRRLYDTEESRYLTQDELAAKIRAGKDVRVVDAKTGADLTQVTLTQIIIEGRGAGKLLPVPLLLQLVRLGDDALAEFMGRYVGAALEMYLSARRGAETLSPFNPFAALPFTASDALARLFMSRAGPAAPAWVEPSPEPPPVAQETADEVAALRRELDALKEAVGAAPRGRRKKGSE